MIDVPEEEWRDEMTPVAEDLQCGSRCRNTLEGLEGRPVLVGRACEVPQKGGGAGLWGPSKTLGRRLGFIPRLLEGVGFFVFFFFF